jgi:hypothetical protein
VGILGFLKYTSAARKQQKMLSKKSSPIRMVRLWFMVIYS